VDASHYSVSIINRAFRIVDALKRLSNAGRGRVLMGRPAVMKKGENQRARGDWWWCSGASGLARLGTVASPTTLEATNRGHVSRQRHPVTGHVQNASESRPVSAR